MLLLHHYQTQNLKLPVVIKSPVKKRAAVYISETVQRNNAIILSLINTHALSGCDTVACNYGIGKSKSVKVLQSGYSITAKEDGNADLTVVIRGASTFVSACNGYLQCADMKTTRQKMWEGKAWESSKSVPKLSSLPPTTEKM